MAQVRKMYIIPADLYDSLFKKMNITENPVFQTQTKMEKEKYVQVTPENNENAAFKPVQQQNSPTVKFDNKEIVQIATVKEEIVTQKASSLIGGGKKRTTRRARLRKKRPILQIPVENKIKLLETFYDYDPNIVDDNFIRNKVASKIERETLKKKIYT